MKQWVFIIFSILSSCKLFSCECVGNSTIKGGLNSADIVIRGIVIRNDITSNYDSLEIKTSDSTSWVNLLKYPIRVVQIKVEETFVGQITKDTISIITNPHEAGCGINFKLGAKFIVYATENDEISSQVYRFSENNSTFWTNSCTRTTPWNLKEEKGIQKEIKKH